MGFDLPSMWRQSGIPAKAVIVVLGIMSAWSIGVMIDRLLAYSAARKQSREFAPLVAGCLKEGKIEEAISVSEQNKKSHLAKVVVAGLQEFSAHMSSNEIPGEVIEASKRALERANSHHKCGIKARSLRIGDDREHRSFRGVVRNRGRNYQRVPRDVFREIHRSVCSGWRHFRSSDHYRLRSVCGRARCLDVQLLQQQD